ncbi:MAG: CinA family protein [Prevotellaceae bacterium]|nr:CinA family protein [Prevotellaceae bacterium]
MRDSDISTRALAMILGQKLKAKRMTIATAESCTAGAIGAAIASVDGASAYYLGSVVTYATRLKTELLKVDATTIERYGVVSRETAVEMNDGVKKLTGANVAISITGYAGATGGDEFAENGTIWICVGEKSKKLMVDGDRTENLQVAVEEALKMAIENI